MRLIDGDALKEDLTRFYDGEVTARELIDEQPTIEAEPDNGWISVKDRLPEDDGMDKDVTHWRHLPEPPKGE